MARARPVVLAIVALALLATAPAASARKMQMGTEGLDVRHLNEELAALGYLPASAVSKRFDVRTWHAVVALQGWEGLPRDGIVGPRTRWILQRRAARPVPSSRADGFEIHLNAQVMLVVRGGRVRRAIHVSTGAPGWGTPLGRFAVYSKQEMSWSRPFQVWMPLAQYFTGGYALHENPSVPAYPASHGCVRVPSVEVQGVWKAGRIGDRVWVEAGNKRARKQVSVAARRYAASKRTTRAIRLALVRVQSFALERHG